MKKLLFLLVISFSFSALSAQEIDVPFGKNRVQYTDDFDSWSRYETQNFITFWYGKSRNVAISAMQLAEYDFREIQNILEHRINEKIELIVYGDLGELYQTNIGLETEDPQNVETIQLVGTKLFVHFDGNHLNLREQIREGVAKVYIYSMLYGSSFQEIVQNSFMADMPEWFKAGIIKYTKNKWTDEDDSKMRYLLQQKRRPYKNFKKLSKREPEIAGKAFWYYLGETYGISSISNIIYLTRINRSVKSAFNYVLGEEYDKVVEECFDYYQARYEKEENEFTRPLNSRNCENCLDKKAFAKNSNNAEYQNLTLSPDGKFLAYASNKNGRIKYFYRNTETGKQKRIKSFGYNNPYRETDYNYPLFFWSEDSKMLGYIYESKNVLELRIRNMENGELFKSTLNPIFNRVYSAEFLDEENLLFSGNTKGYSDLYSYNLNTRIEKNITDDFYDDLDASITNINGIRGILFSSNRNKTDILAEDIDTTLAINTFDIYFLPWEDRSKLFRITNTELSNEFQAEFTANRLSFITDKYGVKSVISQPLSNNFKPTSDLQSIQLTSNIISKACVDETCYYSTNFNNRALIMYDTLNAKKPQYTVFKKEILEDSFIGPIIVEDEKESVDDLENIPDGWFFDTEFDDPPVNEESIEKEELKTGDAAISGDHVHQFEPLRATPSRLRFKILDMSSDLDNQPLFGGLNSYAGDRVGYQQPPMGLLMKMKVGDSFEDYLFEGGVRVATNFSGYEAFVTHENRKRQWDIFYGMYYRYRSNRRIDIFINNDRIRQNTYIGYYQVRYPFNEFQSIRLSATLRSDRDYTLITNDETFNSPVLNTQRIGLRAEYVFDNSSRRSLNIYNGSRSKAFVEGMNRFRFQAADPFTLEPSNGYMTILGLDSRYYLPVLSKSVLAARISTGTTIGSEKILYYVGGVERAFFAGFDESSEIPNRNYAFENLAPQIRGFQRNIRNGTSYFVTTVELRVPIFRHIFSDQIKYDFIREFQVVGFMDAGTAWHGLTPYSDENPNISTFDNGGSILLNVQFYRDPMVLGYGFGFRTSIFGYFLKLDFARGVETRDVLPLRTHISMGTDF